MKYFVFSFFLSCSLFPLTAYGAPKLAPDFDVTHPQTAVRQQQHVLDCAESFQGQAARLQSNRRT